MPKTNKKMKGGFGSDINEAFSNQFSNESLTRPTFEEFSNLPSKSYYSHWGNRNFNGESDMNHTHLTHHVKDNLMSSDNKLSTLIRDNKPSKMSQSSKSLPTAQYNNPLLISPNSTSFMFQNKNQKGGSLKKPVVKKQVVKKPVVKKPVVKKPVVKKPVVKKPVEKKPVVKKPVVKKPVVKKPVVKKPVVKKPVVKKPVTKK